MNRKKISKDDILFISIVSGITSAILMFFLIGIPTAVIESGKFTRMIPANGLDAFFLLSTSILFGIFFGTGVYIRLLKGFKHNIKKGFGGAIVSYFAVSCPTCISFLVAIFGAAFMMIYYDPISPFLGFFSVGLIGFAINNNIKIIKGECKTCKI